MDMFMDKLAQKLTAQEIIKANTAADVEELNRLKNQIAEYNECLARLQKLIDDGFAKASGIQEKESELAGAVAESTGETRQLLHDVEEFKGLLGRLQGQIEDMGQSVSAGVELASESLGKRIDQLCGQLEAQGSAGLTERLDMVEENVHKECVKVYRNVQAVMVEESGKQSDALAEAKAEMASVKGKLGGLLGVSVAALIMALAGVAIQVLGGLGVLF